MYSERKLHPIALLKEMFDNLRKSIIPIVIGLFYIFQAIKNNQWFQVWLFPILIVIVILLMLAPAAIKYWTYRYTLEEKGLRIKYGLIFRKNIFIPYERIQTVQQKQWFFFIPFNVVQILVETAGTSGKAEADLSAVPKSVAQELKDLRDGKKAEKAVEQGENPDQAIENSFAVQNESEDSLRTVELKTKELLLMAVTSSGVFGSLALIIAFLSQFWEAIPEEWLASGFEQAIQLGVLLFVILAILLLIVLWIFSIILTLFKFFQFKLHQFEDHLVVEKGLFERDTTTIKYERIQGVVIVESPLRQMLRLVSVKIITAGGADEQNQSGNILLIPIMKKQLALETIKEILPAYHFEETKIEKLPKQNRARFLMIYLGWSIIPFLILSVLFYPFGLIALLLPLLAGLKAMASFRATGFSLSEGTLLLRARPFLSKTTHLVRKERIQSMKVSRSIWMERTKTNHLSIALKSGESETTPFLRYLAGEQTERIYKWYHPNA